MAASVPLHRSHAAGSPAQPTYDTEEDLMRKEGLLPLDPPSTRELICAKLLYFLLNAGRGTFNSFMPVYLASIGIAPTYIGVISAIMPASSLVASPLMGAIADYKAHYRLVLQVLVGVYIVTRLALLLPGIDTFWAIFVVILIGDFCGAPIPPLLDSSVLVMLGRFSSTLYGKQRMFGALGLGIAGPLAGFAARHVGMPLVFVGVAVMMGTLLVVVSFMPMQTRHKPQGSIFKSIVVVFSSGAEVRVFFAVIFVVGTVAGFIRYYLFLFIDELGGNEMVMGAAQFVMCMAEVPVFYHSSTVIEKLGSDLTVAVAMFCQMVRLVLYSLITDPWAIVPVESLHGVTFGLMYAAGVQYTNQIAPVGLTATFQGVFTAIYAGLAYAVGAFGGGLMMEYVGLRDTFQYAIVYVGGALLVFLTSILYWRHSRGDHPFDEKTPLLGFKTPG